MRCGFPLLCYLWLHFAPAPLVGPRFLRLSPSRNNDRVFWSTLNTEPKILQPTERKPTVHFFEWYRCSIVQAFKFFVEEFIYYMANSSFVTFRKTNNTDSLELSNKYVYQYTTLRLVHGLFISFRSVDAIGPLQNKLTVHASADTYQRYTRLFLHCYWRSRHYTTHMFCHNQLATARLQSLLHTVWHQSVTTESCCCKDW